TLASAQGGLLTFTTPVAGTFGNKVGAALAGEKVAVVRVPQFTDVTIPATSALSASAWDGTLGGVVVFRATGTVQLDGAIHADGIGFRQGSSASTSTPQQAGESYGGQPANGVSGTNLGAGGGGFNLCETAHLNQNDSWFGAGGSYGSTGVSGSSNPSAICATSVQGLPYGTPTLARMFLGSGSGTQVNNTHAACSDAICPSESRSTYTTAFKSNALSACDTATNPSCAATFAACPAETQSFGAARFKNGASSCDTSHNPTCAATFATCGGGSYNISVGHGAASSSFDGRTFGNWADTSLATTCGAYTLSHVAAQASNDSRFSPSQPAWNDTHAFCSGFESAHSAASHAGGTFTSSTPNITVWNDTNSFCSAFNVSSASSYTQAGNTCTGACAQTAAACGTYNITYGAASASNDGRFSPSQSQWNLTTGLCNTSNSGHSSYYDAPASACGSTCADTRAFCSPYQSSAVAASKSNDGRFSPSSAQWTATNALCGSSNVGFSAATRPCAAGTNSCSNTFASCSIYTNNIGSASCSGTCPSAPVNNPSSCTSCGCGIWNQHDCFQAECVNSYPGHCGSSDGNPDGQKNHEISDGCETTCSLGFSCPNSEDRCTSTGCGFLGLGSPCYRPVYRCWNGPSGAGGNCPGNGSSACNSCCFAAANNSTCVNSPADSSCNGWCQTNSGCTTNPGCETNPGCTYNPGCTVNPGCTNNPGCTSSPGCNSNPGCTTNVGCTMNPGCHTCGGCDYTAPGNTCACPAPDQKVADGGRGGGIVFIIASRVVVGTSGRISAVGADPAGGSPSAPNFAGGSGGSLWLRAGTLTLPASASTMTINARGGKNGGDGRIRLERVNGDDPVARSLIAPAPYLAPFLEPQIVGRPLLASTLASAGKKVTALQLVAAIDGLPLTGAPLVQHDYSLNAGASWTTLTLGQDAPITPTNDVRFRAHFVPRAGNVPQTSGLVWRLKLQ
ncbi:MAG: hypothetical protein JST92_10290, partial [Deltaproteobacteria bacterium]|nr:hypothetical protein [Deltaproteobacteria bacterium]